MIARRCREGICGCRCSVRNQPELLESVKSAGTVRGRVNRHSPEAVISQSSNHNSINMSVTHNRDTLQVSERFDWAVSVMLRATYPTYG